MSVKFKSLAKGQPGVVGGGNIKYYASIVRGSKVDLRTVLDDISELNIIHPGAVLGVLEAFLSRVNYHLVNGRAIDLGQLGSFYPAIKSIGEASPDEVDVQSIQRFKVNFRPSALLSRRLSLVEFTKVQDDSIAANLVR